MSSENIIQDLKKYQAEIFILGTGALLILYVYAMFQGWI